ncbi:hypothetical protein ThrDRAFT_03767 [Frankia casuarinae]|uniref:Uncharacterized protein n=1 Tax=Frankia casuarinae (strain DSM 45818 / CECT 9043 / HFP020203 / CcI3) TaxID=106370 RepID=Q2JE74_FRACC|nr:MULTISPECIES: SGNH hydrolase domain-containing protein [Frankia]ABD10418.1 hypothetical protein Francci3_1036 [Frankia casuarinae]ETA00785.1 hypothetical protein CcI6DRAFT_03819 [Frankia sp. CcI6]EYT90609.1 hypothetical protein ThrDRAFT_03767 [Frankia casuarinae]KDA41397.1 hypothetical protein BMG523Draft_03770 [Frankia sp. BMG5.23]KEZ34905.1 GDSL-like Lipase/Acylhydrolase family [Frankia sp. CeD]
MRIGRRGPIGWLFVVAIVLVGGALVVNRTSDDRPRVALWGDSLAWEAGDAFDEAARADGGTAVLVRTWGGTAPCDWLMDIRDQARRWRPTTAVLVFSGNQVTPCMQGRDLVTAYREDVTKAVTMLTNQGIEVVLVDAPPRRDQTVDEAGMTPLDRLWRQIAAEHERTRVVPAGRVLTMDGRFTSTMPCAAGETCEPGGVVTVRSPDGVHFCPLPQKPMTACPVPSPGAVRFGTAIARETLQPAAG